MYQRNATNNDNRRQLVIQSHHFTYQHKFNHELQIQALNAVVADLQNQNNNLSSGGGGGGGGDIGTMQINKHIIVSFICIYIQTCGCEYLYLSPEITNPVPNACFKHTPPTQT